MDMALATRLESGIYHIDFAEVSDAGQPSLCYAERARS